MGETASNALGCGRQKGYLHQYRGAIEEVMLLKKIRLAIFFALKKLGIFRVSEETCP